MTSMGVPRKDLPHWDDIQIMAAQMATKPLLDNVAVGTDLVIGPNAERPLRLDIPLSVSDMSFGALSEEAKTALAQGAELAGTGICSGEGGMLPEEQANSRYCYELASAQFGYDERRLRRSPTLVGSPHGVATTSSRHDGGSRGRSLVGRPVPPAIVTIAGAVVVGQRTD